MNILALPQGPIDDSGQPAFDKCINIKRERKIIGTGNL